MEHQTPALIAVRDFAVVDAGDLSRRDEDQRSFPVIVLVAPVKQRPAVDVFEVNAVEPEVFETVAHGFQFRKIDDAYQRMQGFHAQQFVVVLYRIQILRSFPYSLVFLRQR